MSYETAPQPSQQSAISLLSDRIREARAQAMDEAHRLTAIADRTFGVEAPVEQPATADPGINAVKTGLQEAEQCLNDLFAALAELNEQVSRFTAL